MGKISLHGGVWTGSTSLILAGFASFAGSSSPDSTLFLIGSASILVGVALAIWGLKYDNKHWWLSIHQWAKVNLAWRFAKHPPGAASNTILPDITVNWLITRLMELRGTADNGSSDSLSLARQVGQEIGDQISLRRLSVWMRVTGSLEKVPHRIAMKGFGVGRDSAGKIVCLAVYSKSPEQNRNVTDIRLNLREVTRIWPELKNR